MPSPLRTLSWLAVLALACRTTTVPNEPTESTAAPAEPTGDAPPIAEPINDPESATSDPPATADTADTAAGTEVAAGSDPGATTGPGPGGPATQPVAAREPLPAPLFPKVDPSCGKDPGLGDPAKPFALKTPDGKDIALANFRGKVVLLNYWGTWCKPCLKELPEFDRLYRRYRKHGLVLIAVATDADAAPVEDFARQRKLAAKLAIGGEAHANSYQSPNFPFSFVVDPKGVIRGSYRSYKPECMGKLEADIRAELDKLGR